MSFLVRFGALGLLARFGSDEPRRWPRGSRVVCRTPRGLEIGEVLSSSEANGEAEPSGRILRGLTVEDDLLLARLEHRRDEAFEACQQKLADRGLSAALVDVEHLFDGVSLIFYFLGEVSPEIESVTAELADAYDSEVQFRRFSETLEAGCGPECGTEEGAGCGDACTTCAVLTACKKH